MSRVAVSRVPRASVWLLGVAGLLVASKLGLALAGGRAATSVLSGTHAGSADEALLGGLYALAHFASVLLAPPLALAGLLRWALERSAGPAQEQVEGGADLAPAQGDPRG